MILDDPATIERARAQGLDLRSRLDDNDSAGALAALDALIHTGPTHTNINDFRALLIEAGSVGA